MLRCCHCYLSLRLLACIAYIACLLYCLQCLLTNTYLLHATNTILRHAAHPSFPVRGHREHTGQRRSALQALALGSVMDTFWGSDPQPIPSWNSSHNHLLLVFLRVVVCFFSCSFAVTCASCAPLVSQTVSSSVTFCLAALLPLLPKPTIACLHCLHCLLTILLAMLAY